MEHNIGVGAIVGLAVASSVYVWNNEKFSKPQKTVLLVCILFPPAQWLGILIISVYNSNVENNKPEIKAGKKLDSAISNLKELKEKGLLTKEEYRIKVDKIEAEKTEQNLKNSLEYKQLKSLFDAGVLTKVEFESKIRLLQNVSEKEVDVKEINKILESVNRDYLKSTEEKNENENNKSTVLYVIIAFFIILIGAIILNSNSNSNNTEDVSIPPVIDTSTVYNEVSNDTTGYQEPIKTKKYAYIVIKTKIPEVYNGENYKFSSKEEYTKEESTVYFCSLSFKDTIFVSEILQMEDYNIENKSQVLLTNYENQVKENLNKIDYKVKEIKLMDCKNPEDLMTIKKRRIESEILDRQIFTFDSYSEANDKQKGIK